MFGLSTLSTLFSIVGSLLEEQAVEITESNPLTIDVNDVVVLPDGNEGIVTEVGTSVYFLEEIEGIQRAWVKPLHGDTFPPLESVMGLQPWRGTQYVRVDELRVIGKAVI